MASDGKDDQQGDFMGLSNNFVSQYTPNDLRQFQWEAQWSPHHLRLADAERQRKSAETAVLETRDIQCR